MNIDLSKYVLTPGQGEVITLGPPNSGKIIILVDPKNTGETRFCMLIQELDPGAVVPVHLHEREEQILFFYSGHGKAILGEDRNGGPSGDDGLLAAAGVARIQQHRYGAPVCFRDDQSTGIGECLPRGQPALFTSGSGSSWTNTGQVWGESQARLVMRLSGRKQRSRQKGVGVP